MATFVSYISLEDTSQEDDGIQPFFEFPTPELLRAANEQLAARGRTLRRDSSGYPRPYPTPRRKRDIFDKQSFASIDKHAVQALVEYLTRPTRSDLDRVRVFFRWISAQSPSSLARVPGSESGTTVQYWLSKIHGNKHNYTYLFLKMCSLAGLHGLAVYGYAKGADYEAKLGEGPYPFQNTYNSWAAIVIDDCWHFVNPYFGSTGQEAGHGGWKLIDDNGQGGKGQVPERAGLVVHACNESYFLTDPEELIYTLYPTDDDACQLLARKVTFREFREMVYVRPLFFRLGFRLLEQRKCVIEACDGEVEIELGLPSDRKLRCMYRLWKSQKGAPHGLGDYKGDNLDRFVLMQQKEGLLSCRIFFPEKGKHKLELFSLDIESSAKGVDWTKQLVCAYVIEVGEPKEGCLPLPANHRQEWGLNPDLERAGLKPISHTDGIIEAGDDGTVEIRFKAERDLEIQHSLHSNKMSPEQLKGNVVQHTEGDDVIMTLKLPQPGDYALNLFARPKGKTGKFYNVCSYLVSTANAAFDPAPFPSMPDDCLGETSANGNARLRLISHRSPLIEANESGEEEIVFDVAKTLILNTVLEHQSASGPVVKENCVFDTQADGTLRFKVQFPEAGAYAFSIYAGEAGVNAALPNVYNFIINVATPKANFLPFPKTYEDWTEGCVLKRQVYGVLPGNQNLPFDIKIPQAVKTAAIASSGWTDLVKDREGFWHGDVNTGDTGYPFKISAELRAGTGQYTTMLLYEVKSPQEIGKLAAKQKMRLIMVRDKRSKEEEIRRRRKTDFTGAKKALTEALEDRDLAKLHKVLREIEVKCYNQRLDFEVRCARTLVKSLQRIEKQRACVLSMDPDTMASITKDTNPIFLLREVVAAVLLLLGYPEDDIRTWSECQRLCATSGINSLSQRIRSFDVNTLHPEIATRALQILPKFRLDDVRDHSEGAGTLFEWAMTMIQELTLMNPDAAAAPPAGPERQKEILSRASEKQR